MRKRDDGVTEMVTEVTPTQAKGTGDMSYREQMLAAGYDRFESHYDDPQQEAMSGYVVYGRKGRKLYED